MTDCVLLLVCRFAEGFSEFVGDKERVVPEAVCAARTVGDFTLDISLCNFRAIAVVVNDSRTKPCGAVAFAPQVFE